MNKIIEKLSLYEGKIETGKSIFDGSDEVMLKSVNELNDRGKIRKISCTIRVKQTGKNQYSIFAEEKTCEIIGGSGCGQMTEDEVLQRIDREILRYNFRHIEKEQTSLF